jgi:protein-L-isoaspartate(D-aspartate) O-methyltransferase
MKRRDFLALSAGAAAFSILPAVVKAGVPVPYDRNAEVPLADKKSFIE